MTLVPQRPSFSPAQLTVLIVAFLATVCIVTVAAGLPALLYLGWAINAFGRLLRP